MGGIFQTPNRAIKEVKEELVEQNEGDESLKGQVEVLTDTLLQVLKQMTIITGVNERGHEE